MIHEHAPQLIPVSSRTGSRPRDRRAASVTASHGVRRMTGRTATVTRVSGGIRAALVARRARPRTDRQVSRCRWHRNGPDRDHVRAREPRRSRSETADPSAPAEPCATKTASRHDGAVTRRTCHAEATKRRRRVIRESSRPAFPWAGTESTGAVVMISRTTASHGAEASTGRDG